MKPLIGIPSFSVYGAPASETRRYVVSRTYVESVLQAGGAVVMIPACAGRGALRPAYRALSGLLLAGGGDVQPHLYGRDEQAQLLLVDPERDAAEILLARWALADDLPLLAICRGIQILNVALGGTLIQDIPSMLPQALVHHPGPAAPRARPQHTATLVSGSRLAAILGGGRPLVQAEVNSFHHQAVEQVAPGLRVAARAPDGIVEALECPERTFVLGLQWHPEEMAAGDPVQAALFAGLVDACRARR